MRALSVAVLTWVSSWDIRCGAVQCGVNGVKGDGKEQVLQSNSSAGKNAPEARENQGDPWGYLHGSSRSSVCSWGWWKGAHRDGAAGSLRLRRCSHIHRQFINTREVILQITKEMELVFNNNPTGLFSIRGIQVKKIYTCVQYENDFQKVPAVKYAWF